MENQQYRCTHKYTNEKTGEVRCEKTIDCPICQHCHSCCPNHFGVKPMILRAIEEEKKTAKPRRHARE